MNKSVNKFVNQNKSNYEIVHHIYFTNKNARLRFQ